MQVIFHKCQLADMATELGKHDEARKCAQDAFDQLSIMRPESSLVEKMRKILDGRR